ncbi:MAG TPA: hypothetical protein VKB80_01485 [Kofleriaceae bacterium]|nr:hypothetical protein [Kofleriaceae bacterium]
MRRLVLLSFALASVLSLSTAFVACGGDDDDTGADAGSGGAADAGGGTADAAPTTPDAGTADANDPHGFLPR